MLQTPSYKKNVLKTFLEQNKEKEIVESEVSNDIKSAYSQKEKSKRTEELKQIKVKLDKVAEEKENSFVPVKLPWQVHPERNQEWRDQQDKDLGPRYAGQECDCDFLASGDTVFEPDDMLFYEKTYEKEPLERRGVDGNLWVWEGVDYTKSYMVVADVARGDSSDYSAFHIFDVETCVQVAEYKGKLSPKDFGNVLVGIASEYNDALLVVENANIGWATIQTIIDRGYKNLFYQSKDLQVVDVEHQINNKYRAQDRNMVPGFSTTTKTRPLVIAKMEEYTREKLVKLHSNRLIDELFVFIYKTGVTQSKAEAMQGYNDDLVMSYSIALWVRDTALRLQKDKNDQQWATMNSMLKSNGNKSEHAAGFGVGSTENQKNPYEMDIGTGEKEDLTWLIK